MIVSKCFIFVLLVFENPNNLALMMTLDLHEKNFLIILFYWIIFNSVLLYAGKFWSRNALAEINKLINHQLHQIYNFRPLPFFHIYSVWFI